MKNICSPCIPVSQYPIAPDFEMSARIVLGRGIFERKNFSRFMEHTSTRDVAVEVGSHVGSWTIGMSKLFNRVIGFEPQPTNRSYLYNNLARANTSNVKIYSNAVVDDLTQAFSITAVGNTRNSGMSYLIPGNHSNDNNPKVSCVRLDDVMVSELASGEHMSALKVDVEGLELEVLKSGRDVIREHQPTILIEINKNSARYGIKHEEIYDFIYGLGYKKADTVHNDHIFIPTNRLF